MLGMSPDAHKVSHLFPEASNRLMSCALVQVNLGSFPDQVDLLRRNDAGLVDQLPAQVENRSKDLHGVALEEGRYVPRSKGAVSIAQNNEGLHDEGNVGSVRLEISIVRERLSVESLGLSSLIVSDKCDTHNDVVDETAACYNGDEPVQDNCRTAANLEEGEEREEHDHTEAVKRDTLAVSIGEELGRAALESQAVKCSGCNIGIGVSGREDRGHDESVHNGRQNLDIEVAHSNDIWRGSCGTATSTSSEVNFNKSRVVVRDDDANGEGANDEEHAESEVNGLEGRFDVDARALGFGRDHGDVFGTDNSESSAPESSQETLKSSEIASASKFLECPRVTPVSETVSVVVGVASDHGDESEAKQEEDKDKLAS